MIGYFGNTKKPPLRVRIMFAQAALHDIDFFYSTIDRVDIENKVILGTFFRQGEYVEEEVGYPLVVDNIHDIRSKYRKIYNSMSKTSLFVYSLKTGGKIRQYEILREKGFGKFLIETYDYKDIDVDKLFNSYSSWIVKPIGGNKGKNIYKISGDAHQKVLSVDGVTLHLSSKDFIDNYGPVFRDGYLVQKYIKSATGFDTAKSIRILCARGKGGKWTFKKIRFSVNALKGSHNSNLGQEGALLGLDAQGFLNVEYGKEEASRIYKELYDISNTLPSAFQQAYPRTIDAVGIDLVIDRNDNNKVYICEVNFGPAWRPFYGEFSEHRIMYYKYLLENYTAIKNGTLKIK